MQTSLLHSPKPRPALDSLPPPPPTKKEAVSKADAMKAAAGVFFGTYTGYADACRKLQFGDPVRVTPHLVYYYKKIASSTELQAALSAQRATEAAETPTATTPAAATAPAVPMGTPAAAKTAPAKTPSPSGGYQVRATLCPTCLHSHSSPPRGRRHRHRRRAAAASRHAGSAGHH